jgi:hypothetical protein
VTAPPIADVRRAAMEENSHRHEADEDFDPLPVVRPCTPDAEDAGPTIA